MFSGASNFVHGVDNDFILISSVVIFFLISITATMLYFVFRFNRKSNPNATQIEGNNVLEIIWTIVPTILVLIMFFYGWSNYKLMKQPPKDAFVIKSTARMWSWSFKYPNGKVTDTLYVPMEKPVRLNLVSLDVIHSMYIPAFRLKQDMVPGSDYFMWFVAQKQGNYEIFCAEFCGMQHSYMRTRVVVMPEHAFNKWYNDTALVAETTASGKPALPGLSIIKKNGCTACHSFDGTRIVGPSFKGIYGEKVTVIVNGNEKQVIVDDDYILESVYEPNAKIVKGFQKDLMQPYKDLIKKEEVKQIIEYIKSLK